MGITYTKKELTEKRWGEEKVRKNVDNLVRYYSGNHGHYHVPAYAFGRIPKDRLLTTKELNDLVDYIWGEALYYPH